MSISIGPTPILDDLILWYDAASYKCYSGEPTTNQLSQDYYGESGVATGDASINLSGLFGLGLISQRPWSHEVWSLDNINKGKLTRYGAYYFDGINDYLEIPDDDAFSFTNGTDDLPFSISAWVRMEDATNFIIISKYGTSDPVREWLLYTDGSDKLNFFIRDTSANTTTRTSSSAITSHEGQWVHISATFGGAGPNSTSGFANAGDEMNLYINGQVISMASAGNNASYTGMSNISQAVWIGRQNVSYSKGHIKNVKIFNRELSATEVSNLYNYNTINGPSLVDFVDEWGEANGATYTSDFSANGNGWSAVQGTVAGNIDSIGGENDNLRLTINSTSAAHYIQKLNVTKAKKRYRMSGWFYIPYTNSNLDGIYFVCGTTGPVAIYRDATPSTDTWVYFSEEFVANPTADPDRLIVYALDGNSTTISDAGGDDVFYIRDIQVTQIGTLADFDLSNYDDNDKITDKSSNKFIASPQGGALARDRWFAHDLSFSKDTDNNDIATITRNPSSGAFYENSNSLTLFGEHPLYVTNASTGDKVSVSLQVKSNQTGLFTGINFFNSGTSASEPILLNRVILPDDYEYIYGTSNLIATGDNVGFELLMNRDFSSGWNYINLKKPQIELKDHATNYTSLTRSGTNAIVNLANRNLYTGTIVNDVKSSGVAKIDGVQAYYPLSGSFWEFNGVDSSISSTANVPKLNNNPNNAYTVECVVEYHDLDGTEDAFWGRGTLPFFGSSTSNQLLFSYYDINYIQKSTYGGTLSENIKYHCVYKLKNYETFATGEMYLNGQFSASIRTDKAAIENESTIYLGQRGGGRHSNTKIYLMRYYLRDLTPQEINHNYRSIKTKYGL